MRLLLLSIFISLVIPLMASAQAQVVTYAGNGSALVRNGAAEDGVFDEYWLEGKQQTFVIDLNPDTTAAYSTGAIVLALELCVYEKVSTSCKVYKKFDTTFDGFPDTNLVTGVFPQGGHSRVVVPRWLRFRVVTQPSGSEKPALSVATVK